MDKKARGRGRKRTDRRLNDVPDVLLTMHGPKSESRPERMQRSVGICKLYIFRKTHDGRMLPSLSCREVCRGKREEGAELAEVELEGVILVLLGLIWEKSAKRKSRVVVLVSLRCCLEKAWSRDASRSKSTRKETMSSSFARHGLPRRSLGDAQRDSFPPNERVDRQD